MPVFNVEKYVAECLESLQAQTLKDIQIIAVDDCSPDGSREILEDYASRDSRLEIISMSQNSGLSAARNAGVAAATGEYLYFVDSDDVISPETCAVTTQILDNSGSDFAIMGYQKFNFRRKWSARWIREIHEQERIGTTASDFPAVMANATAWSKIFRRSFWDDAGLMFREGMTYEDQETSAKAYALAKKIDILDQTFYFWRDREDHSSITQQTANTVSLQDFTRAANLAIKTLLSLGSPGLATQRLCQILAYDMTYTSRRAVDAPPDYWDLLVIELKKLFEHKQFADWIWDEIPPIYRIAYEMALRDDYRRFCELFREAGSNLKGTSVSVKNGQAYAELPFYGDSDTSIPASRFKLRSHDLTLITSARRTWWHDNETIVIDGWAYIDNIDHERYPIATSATLVDSTSGAEIPCTLETRRDPNVSESTSHRIANYEPSGFRIKVPARRLSSFPFSRWTIRLDATAAGITSTQTLRGKPLHSAPRFFESEIRIQSKTNSSQEFLIVVGVPAISLVSAKSEDSRLQLVIRANRGKDWTKLVLLNPENHETEEFALKKESDDTYSAILPLSHLVPAPATDASWTVQAINKAGKSAPISWSQSTEVPQWNEPSQPRLTMKNNGSLAIEYSDSVIVIDQIEIDSKNLIFHLSVNGLPLDLAEFKLQGEDAGSSALKPLRLGPNTVRVPIEAQRWGRPLLPLPIGSYRFSVSSSDLNVRVEFSDQLKERCPLIFENSRFRAQLTISRHGVPFLRVLRPLTVNERGARRQSTLRAEHAESTAPIQKGVALFRSYFGENTACNAGAVHTELKRRNSKIKVYWAVTDYSVPVPDGGIPVIHESEQWYDLLSTAEYYIENMHQPIYHRKPVGQKIVATFHGYPFKLMGLPWWKKLGFSQDHIESYLRRSSEWDFLVSPASYATELLCRDFGYTGKVLEIGYPRNDSLLAGSGAEIRKMTRRRLGLDDSQTAILYAPTFRDYLSDDDLTAAKVDFVDLDEIAMKLGPDFKILVRGHAFNARAGEKFQGEDIVDVTHYPDVSELYLAADAAIVDYSSLRFDFALTRKPMIFLVPDKQRYIDGRGWLLDFDQTAPGPQVVDTQETLHAIQNLKEIEQMYATAYEKFLATYADLDDGKASSRLVDQVFKEP